MCILLQRNKHFLKHFVSMFLLFSVFLIKAKLACHPARCLLPVEIIERCDLATGLATAIFIALLIR